MGPLQDFRGAVVRSSCKGSACPAPAGAQGIGLLVTGCRCLWKPSLAFCTLLLYLADSQLLVLLVAFLRRCLVAFPLAARSFRSGQPEQLHIAMQGDLIR